MMNNYKEDILKLLTKGNTSYKYFYLLACVNLLESNKRQYSFLELSKGMVAMSLLYGNFANERYTKNDRLFDFAIYLVSNYPDILLKKSLVEIIEFIDKLNDKYINKMLNQIINYVPYRFISYGKIADELKNKNDWEKNKLIEEMSSNYWTIYEINNKNIIWKEEYYSFILRNKQLLHNEILNIINAKFKRM